MPKRVGVKISMWFNTRNIVHKKLAYNKQHRYLNVYKAHHVTEGVTKSN